jgi:hypothetical protein
MQTHKILLKDFGNWAQSITNKVRACCAAQAEALGIPLLYLKSSAVDKEALAREIARERKVETGNICMFSVVEPCYAPQVKGDRASKKLNIEVALRKCIFVYHYWNDPVVGFGHTRLQTWLPLSSTICLNGRHWLERQLLNEGIEYRKDGNCFTSLSDLSRAQQLFDDQQRTGWPVLLTSLLQRNCPIINGLFGHEPLHYYWSADETEWASDIMFKEVAELEKIYPSLLRHSLVAADSPAVMRFFGKRAVGIASSEIVSDYRKRYEGVRLKHWLSGNSVKVYNKAGNVLRVETTITNTRDFKVFRHPDDDASRPASWQKMRKGVSDLHRRAEISQACNNRYAEHLAATTVTGTLKQVAGDICSRTSKDGRSYRAINPWSAQDYSTLQFIAQGANAINGFRNRDLRNYLYPESGQSDDKLQVRSLSAKVTRHLALLRAHGLIKKVSRTTRYILTTKGHTVAAAILAASAVDPKKLMEMAA